MLKPTSVPCHIATAGPWHTDPAEPSAITIELDGVRRYLLVIVRALTIQKVAFLEGAIDRPWPVDPEDRCSILAHMEDMNRMALTGLHQDDATAALAQYVVDLHNARLMGSY